MKVQKASIVITFPWLVISHGDDLADPGRILAKVKDKRLAHQFAASDEMFLVCELLDGAEDDAQLLRELIKKARAIVARVEGEQS